MAMRSVTCRNPGSETPGLRAASGVRSTSRGSVFLWADGASGTPGGRWSPLRSRWQQSPSPPATSLAAASTTRSTTTFWHRAVIDAMGHGRNAAMLATLAICDYQHARRANTGLADLYGQMYEAIHHQFGPEQFVTAQMMRLDASTGRLLIRDHRVIQARTPTRRGAVRAGALHQLRGARSARRRRRAADGPGTVALLDPSPRRHDRRRHNTPDDGIARRLRRPPGRHRSVTNPSPGQRKDPGEWPSKRRALARARPNSNPRPLASCCPAMARIARDYGYTLAELRKITAPSVGDARFEHAERRDALDRQNEGVLGIPAHHRGGRGQDRQGGHRAGQPRPRAASGRGRGCTVAPLTMPYSPAAPDRVPPATPLGVPVAGRARAARSAARAPAGRAAAPAAAGRRPAAGQSAERRGGAGRRGAAGAAWRDYWRLCAGTG